jgi:Low-density lipoprotein receptor repeat class B
MLRPLARLLTIRPVNSLRKPSRRAVAGAPLAVVAILMAAAPASAAERVFWANRYGGTISFANLDGTGGGGQLPLTGATPSGPFGVAIDTAHGKLYWPNFDNNTISFANLNGSGGGGQLSVAGTSISGPTQLSFDLGAGRVYWANHNNNTISFANLNNSGGGNVNITAGAVSSPFGVAVDPAAGRIYWTNAGNNTIQFANIDGSGSGTVNVGSATVAHPIGIAVDTVDRRLYWANFDPYPAGSIGFANLNGSASGNLNTSGATVNGPEGIALDVAAGRVYWANPNSNKVSYASLNNSGGGHDLALTGATPNFTTFPVLLQRPVGTGAPTVSGGTGTGSTLSCTNGSWAADQTPENLFRAPQTFAFQWLLNGSPIGGATGSSVVASAAGTYQCVVTALNAAGGTSQTSGGVGVVAPPADTDHDGIIDPLDRCPTVPAGRFDVNHDGCPGPYAKLRISTLGGWTISDKGVSIRSMKVLGLRSGVTVRFVCKSCHINQKLTAKGSTLSLSKLKRKLLKRRKGFSLTATGLGLIGDRLTLTVKNFGHTHAAFVKVSGDPFTAKHACLPVGSSSTAKTCSATPPTGP